MNRSSYGWRAEVVEPEIVLQVASKPEVSIGIKLQYLMAVTYVYLDMPNETESNSNVDEF
ncbi:hypothetical protein E2986_11384 [Frieseomelitta varia]|uniref:Uncharacterized protein n=1 Tax=Frieseomelitta varia TaxID=561572 RepID=A0A833VN76_9HYME|nr:hypothetical protein E2986_11384 [Frieseomelitta varia]